MKQDFLTVDLGATSGRTILGPSIEGELNLEGINRFPNHLIGVGGHFYWNIYALYRYIIDGLKLVAHRGESTASVSIDTWRVDFVLLRRDGNLLRQFYAYRDPYTVEASETFFSHVSRSRVYGKIGIQVMNFNSLFQLDTLRCNHGSALEAADKALFMPDALNYILTGKMVTGYTIASTTQLVSAHTQHLEPELLEAVGLKEENFDRFVSPGEKIGTLAEEAQKITGLGAIPVIAVAGHDTGPAVAAVPALDRNSAYLSSGVWSLVGVETGTPIITAETEALSFTNEGDVEGTIRLLKNICGMWLLERCRLNWGDTNYPELITEADSYEPFHSLINPNDDCFANSADMGQTIREYCQTTGQPVPEQRGQIVRCVFESLALRYRRMLENLRTLSPRPIEILHVIGGGSRNGLLNRFTANAISIPVMAGPSEVTTIGNVMTQTMTMGEAMNVAGMRQLINCSIPLKTYHLQDMIVWDAAYVHLKNYVR